MVEPDGRVVPPDEFLPVCEQYALIGEIDWWVLKQAARLAGAGSPVQVNLSARSVVDPDVLEHIERCIEQHEVAPGTLVFEITETAVVEDEAAARTFAERLHALGCKVALDDFGTGYGSLTYLKQIPVDYLKLDIEFVRDLHTNEASRHVVQALVALARDFHLQTVGEGVVGGRGDARAAGPARGRLSHRAFQASHARDPLRAAPRRRRGGACRSSRLAASIRSGRTRGSPRARVRVPARPTRV